MDFRSNYRAVLVKLPPDLAPGSYAAIAHAIFSVLDVAGVAGVSSVVTDKVATDPDMRAAFGRHCEDYPWGA